MKTKEKKSLKNSVKRTVMQKKKQLRDRKVAQLSISKSALHTAHAEKNLCTLDSRLCVSPSRPVRLPGGLIVAPLHKQTSIQSTQNLFRIRGAQTQRALSQFVRVYFFLRKLFLGSLVPRPSVDVGPNGLARTGYPGPHRQKVWGRG